VIDDTKSAGDVAFAVSVDLGKYSASW